MKRYWAGLLVALALVVTAGCQQNKQEPVAQAPPQEEMPAFPESQVPPPEPQPEGPEPKVYAPPVDSAADADQQPKESYAPAQQKEDRVYVVRKGDTLYKISQQVYGNKKDWRKIYQANKDVLKEGPDKLAVGMKLAIPE